MMPKMVEYRIWQQLIAAVDAHIRNLESARQILLLHYLTNVDRIAHRNILWS